MTDEPACIIIAPTAGGQAATRFTFEDCQVTSPRPTYEDAELILRLYEMRREPRLRQGRAWFVSSFKVKNLAEFAEVCPPGSDQHASYRMVTTYWEMVASFVTSGVLNEELFFQSGRELLLVYERMQGILPLLREQQGDSTSLGNLEAVARRFIDWWERHSPGAPAAFAKRIRG